MHKIRKVGSDSASPSATSAAYFFCTSQVETQVPNVMTKALISNISNQLLEQDRSYREYLSKLDDVYTAYQARMS